MMLSLNLLLLSFLSTVLGELEFAVHVKGGNVVADIIAAKHGMQNMGEVIPNTNYFLLRTLDNSRKKRSVRNITHVFEMDTEVDWSEFQTPLTRVKRNKMHASDFYVSEIGRRLLQNSLLNKPWSKFNDPMWKDMWYLNRKDDLTMMVEGAWKLGVTGSGVTVTIVDDGIEKDNPDLIRNYDPLASTDRNDNDSDPSPRYDISNTNDHGTRCAGVVSATSNNSVCGVGIAFNAKIGGIRMLDGQITDAVEAKSLSFNQDHIDIYSNSWGPPDDGETLKGPGKLASRALQQGIQRGRSGKGSIYVWASGNGGMLDDCNCDGYAASIFTIAVSSTNETGANPSYSEECSAILATTYSGGTIPDRKIVTTDINHKCTSDHSGTSASAPMAAAIIALSLEINLELTWRDVQHIMVRTSRPGNLKALDWNVNGVNRRVSHSYGYGLMDAESMVKLARRWNSVPSQQSCEVTSPDYYTPYPYKSIPAKGNISIELDVNSCPGVRNLEHVVSRISVTAGKWRGDLKIILRSPSGTHSTLLNYRMIDFSSSGFINWPFMTTHSWGESSNGKWILEIHNYDGALEAKFSGWSLNLFGTEVDSNSYGPEHHAWNEYTKKLEEVEKDLYQSIDTCYNETILVCDLGHTCVLWKHKCDGYTDCASGRDKDICQTSENNVVLHGFEVKQDARTTDSITLIWEVLTHDVVYKYSYSIHKHETWNYVSKDWVKNKNHEYQFSGLQPATEYDFRVFAKSLTDKRSIIHSPVVHAKTRDGVPSPPLSLKAEQKEMNMELSWSWPSLPKGEIQVFVVRVFQAGEQTQEVHKRVTAKDHERARIELTLSILKEGDEYELEIVAVNEEHQSEPSSRVRIFMMNRLGELKLKDTGNKSMFISWDARDYSMFTVSYRSDNPLDHGQSQNVTKGRIHLTGLSPQTTYYILVSAISTSGSTTPASIQLKTKGLPIPIPEIVQSDNGEHSNTSTSVKLSWYIKPGSQKLQYGVWFGMSQTELISSTPLVTLNNTATISDLTACTDYLFAVAVLDPHAGLGKISNFVQISTKFSPTASPHNVTVVSNKLYWGAPCDILTQSLGYVLQIQNEMTRKKKWIKLPKLSNLSLSYTLEHLEQGAKYNIKIVVNSKDTVPSEPVYMYGPPVPAPTSVYAHPATEGFDISWAPVPSAVSYEVVLSPDPTFSNLTCSIRLPVQRSPITIMPQFNGKKSSSCLFSHHYSIAVRSVNANKYKSVFSKAGLIMMSTAYNDAEKISNPEKIAVWIVVGVFVVIILCGACFCYYVFSIKYMRSRFKAHASGYWSSITGAATIMDDDDNSPIIRGFSDNESLIM
eukprot:GFUD01004797.1.p1 GENE.GFUD01004797.1~~GFUD01004797.1.p1  ORF type:complete len:1325 (+),score=279.92 GFUD01004797.1:106-4080(+)